MPLYVPPQSAEIVAPAELGSLFTVTSTASDVTGLTLTFPAPSDPFLLRLVCPKNIVVTAGDFMTVQITDSANTVLSLAQSTVSTANGFCNQVAEMRLPSATFPITPGTSYTFKVRALTGNAAGGSITSGATARVRFSARF